MYVTTDEQTLPRTEECSHRYFHCVGAGNQTLSPFKDLLVFTIDESCLQSGIFIFMVGLSFDS